MDEIVLITYDEELAPAAAPAQASTAAAARERKNQTLPPSILLVSYFQLPSLQLHLRFVLLLNVVFCFIFYFITTYYWCLTLFSTPWTVCSGFTLSLRLLTICVFLNPLLVPQHCSLAVSLFFLSLGGFLNRCSFLNVFI
jgi:hypothetical protein